MASRATAAYVLPHPGAWVAALIDSPNPRNYWSMLKWSMLKRKLTDEGYDELYRNCVQLKMRSLDGKRHTTDAADVEAMLRIM